MACASTLINNAQYAAEWYFKLSRAYSDGTSPGTPPPFIVDPNNYNDGDTPGNAKYWSELGETSLAAYAAQASASATNAATSASQAMGYAATALASQIDADSSASAALSSSNIATNAKDAAEAYSIAAGISAAAADTDADAGAVSAAAAVISAEASSTSATNSEGYMLSAEADMWAAEAARQEAEYWAQQAANSAAAAVGYDPSDELTWMDYVGNWTEEPTLVGATVEGDVYSYVYTTSTYYRLVPYSTSTLKDSFYETWNGSDLTNLVTTRTLNI